MGTLAPNDLKFNQATGRWWCVWHQTALEPEEMLTLCTKDGVSYPVCPECVLELNPQNARLASVLCFFHDGSRDGQPEKIAHDYCKGNCTYAYCDQCLDDEGICVFCKIPGVAEA
jgi:hypothetical protein